VGGYLCTNVVNAEQPFKTMVPVEGIINWDSRVLAEINFRIFRWRDLENGLEEDWAGPLPVR